MYLFTLLIVGSVTMMMCTIKEEGDLLLMGGKNTHRHLFHAQTPGKDDSTEHAQPDPEGSKEEGGRKAVIPITVR